MKKKFKDQIVVPSTKPKYKEIDFGMRKLIRELNQAGYTTTSCCQGRTKVGDKHSNHAYIGFERQLTKNFIRQIEKAGLEVSHNNLVISSRVNDATTPERAIVENSFFQERIRSLFEFYDYLWYWEGRVGIENEL